MSALLLKIAITLIVPGILGCLACNPFISRGSGIRNTADKIFVSFGLALVMGTVIGFIGLAALLWEAL